MDAEPAAATPEDDAAAVAELVRVFFAGFRSGEGSAGRLDRLREVLLPRALIVRAGEPEPAVHDVESFLAPRRELLGSGRLTGFREWPVGGRTEISGDIAQHSCAYAKEGVRDGTPFTGRGHKFFQFVRTPGGWRISAVAWHDET